MRCFSKQCRPYCWRPRQWKANKEVGTRLSPKKRYVVRQYHSQATERRVLHDIPFENILPPIAQQKGAVSQKRVAPRAPETKNDHVTKVEDLGRDTSRDSAVVTPSIRASNRDTDRIPHEITYEVNKYEKDHRDAGVRDEAPTPNHNGPARGLELRKAPSLGNEPVDAAVEMQQPAHVLPITRKQNLKSKRFENATHAGNLSKEAIEPETKPLALATATDLISETPVSEKIHILGTGPVGKFIAHSLIGLSSAPPITLLIHRPDLLQQWYDEGGVISLVKGRRVDIKSGFNVEWPAGSRRDYFARGCSRPLRNPSSGRQECIIQNLIVTTEGYKTVAALAAIKHRLRPSSTICFIQDGLGVIDLVNSSVFPDLMTRPNYMLGNISHELRSAQDKFSVAEQHPGSVSLTIIPRGVGAPQVKREGLLVRRLDLGWPPNSKYLMRTLSRTPELCATGFRPQDFYKAQLEKLAINSVLGPVSVLYDCCNEQLLHNYHASQTMKLLLKEISTILQSLPEVSRVPSIEKHFGAERLERLVLSVIGKTGRNRTAMLQAVLDGNRTEIDFYNGYLLRRAVELGIDCPRLEFIISVVKGKQNTKSREKNSYIPFRDEY